MQIDQLRGVSVSEYWGLSLDDLAERVWEIKSDAKGSHYIAFEGNKEAVRQRMIDAFAKLIDEHMYRASPYGSQWQEGDDDDA